MIRVRVYAIYRVRCTTVYILVELQQEKDYKKYLNNLLT